MKKRRKRQLSNDGDSSGLDRVRRPEMKCDTARTGRVERVPTLMKDKEREGEEFGGERDQGRKYCRGCLLGDGLYLCWGRGEHLLSSANDVGWTSRVVVTKPLLFVVSSLAMSATKA